MTISELIERLEALKAEHGDLPCYGQCVTCDVDIEVKNGYLGQDEWQKCMVIS